MAVEISPLVKPSRLRSRGGLLGECLAEFLGTFVILSFGAGVVAMAVAAQPGSGRAETATTVFLEETNFRDRASIVHLLPRLPPEVGRAIPTLWTFGTNAQGCCSGRCVAYCSGNDGGGFGLGYCGHRKQGGGHMVCV